ncbi:MAG: alpha/beta hydrolase [Caulobacteraceae bacterium]|nr:alpha/beta hydrolase [Caulobacteraceae bacterium]
MRRRELLALGAATLAAGGAWRAAPETEGAPIVIGQSHRIDTGDGAQVVNVWLPASYAGSDRRYPVLYLLDGGVDEDFHHISGLARISGEYGVTREFMVVGIESGPRRRALMTFPSADPDDLKAVPVNGGAAGFRRRLIDEIAPWVEHRYRTTPERALMGESLAGLFVVETLLREPGAFQTYIAIDPSLWWNKGSLVREAGLPGWRRQDPPRRVYIAMSTQGPREEGERLRKGLEAATVLDYRLSETETHASIYHPAATSAFRAVFANPPAP